MTKNIINSAKGAVKTIFFVLFLFGFTHSGQAQIQITTPWTLPRSGINVTGVGDDNWTNPGRITADDNSEARADINDLDESRYLRGTDFGFLIPAGATINGIEVRIERDAETANRLRDLEVFLMKSGTIAGDNKAVLTGSYSKSTVNVDYGGGSDLWNTTWTPAEINATNFGISFRCWKYATQDNARWVDIDKIQIRVTYTPDPTAPVTLSSKVSANSDDAEEYLSASSGYAIGDVDVGSSDLEMPWDGLDQIVGMRFENINVPNGVNVSDAYIQFTADENGSSNVTLEISGELNTNASTFSANNFNITSRTSTSAKVNWSPSAWVNNSRGANERTVDISSIINEITSQAGWVSGNSIVIMVSGSGSNDRRADSHDESSSDAPELFITYTNAPAIDMSITQTISDATPEVGDAITFDIVVSNSSTTDTAKSIEVVDLIPSGYSSPSIFQITSGTSYNIGTGVWTIGDVAANSSVNLKISAIVGCNGEYTNVAEISKNSEFQDNIATNNIASSSIFPSYGSVVCLVAKDDFSSAISTEIVTSAVAITDILQNDLVNGNQAAPTAVTISVTTPFSGSGVTYDANTRSVNVAPGTAAGDYTMEYKICEVTDGNNCSSGIVYVFVSDLIDDYINQPVPSCQNVPDPTSDFGIQLDYETASSSLISLYSSPLMADIDNDGVVEILALSNNNQQTSGGNRSATDIHVFNGETGALEQTIATPRITFDGATAFAIADVDGDGFGEIIIASHHASIGGNDLYLFCYEHDGTQKWKSNTQYGLNVTAQNGSSYGTKSAPSVGIADFNQDGTPEVYVYNEIYNALTGVKLIDGGANGVGDPAYDYLGVDQGISSAGDLTPSAGLELAAGRTVYEVTITNLAGTAGNVVNAINLAESELSATFTDNIDGFTGLADLDLDGQLDVLVAAYDGSNSIVYAWNPRLVTGSRLIGEFDLGDQSRHGAFFIGDVDADGDPDVGICQSQQVEMLSYANGAFTRKWTLSTNDGSGRTGITMFDFNQDGAQEMVYRDESTLRIFDGSGSSPVVLASFSVSSNTGMEGPIIGDVDSDGSAEILIANEVSDRDGQIQIYSSSLDPWAPARNVWNQYTYFNTHISDDLSIPQNQSNHGQQLFFDNQFCPTQYQERPLNTYNVQSTYFTVNGCPSFPVFDAAIVISSATLSCPGTDAQVDYTIYNNGDIEEIPAGIIISFYSGNPQVSGSTLISSITLANAIGPGANSGNIQTVLTNISSNTEIYAVVNDNGLQAVPIELPTTSFFECDYTNNIASFTVRCENANPDINATFVNVEVPGNVATNDDVLPGTTYGGVATLVSSPAGSAPSLSMNADGSYTFKSGGVGLYEYSIEVCVPPLVNPNCSFQELRISVVDPAITPTGPMANTDIAITNEDSSVVLVTLENDMASSSTMSFVTDIPNVSITSAPDASTEGVLSVDPLNGNITFTPVSSFTGVVTYQYTICEGSLSSSCETVTQKVTVLAEGSKAVSASDDANRVFQGSSIAVSAGQGILANDLSTSGANLFVSTAYTGSQKVAGKGTFIISADGSFTFTSEVGFAGPVSYEYEVCDGTACANATLYILVYPFATNPDINVTFVNEAVSGDVNTNDIISDGVTYGTPDPDRFNPNDTDIPAMSADGTYTFTPSELGVYVFEVPVCLEGQTPVSSCATESLIISVEEEGSTTGVPPVVNTDIGFTKEDINVVIKSLANDSYGTAGTALDVTSVSVVTGTEPNVVTEGSLTVDASSGDITFDPVPGFVGTVEYKYSVSDNSTSALSNEAQQFITVLPTEANNSIDPADDYVEIELGVTATGNVLTNDIDPDGDLMTVTSNTINDPGIGVMTFNSDGSYTFVPDIAITARALAYVYTVCDNASSQACGEATLHILVNPEIFAASGSMWYDLSGLTDGIYNGTAQGSSDEDNAGTEPLYINYINAGIVLAEVPVATDGTWSMDASGYSGATFQMSTVQGVVGEAKPATTLPIGWGNTAEGTGTGPSPVAGDDGTPDGEFTTTLSAALTGLNFGFQQLPVTAPAINDITRPNPTATNMQIVDVTLFGGTDDGNIEKIRITEFPKNANSFAVGGFRYYPDAGSTPASGACPTGYTCQDFSALPDGYVEFFAATNTSSNVAPVVEIDPVDNGSGTDPVGTSTTVTSSFTYTTADNAGFVDDATGILLIPFSGDRSMTVTATPQCINDIPYLTIAVSANFDFTGLDATVNWTAGTFDNTLLNAGTVAKVLTYQQANVTVQNILNPSTNLWTGDATLLWPGAEESGGVATNWPGWVNDPSNGWRAEEDGYSGYRDAGTSISVTVNPTAVVPTVNYPPSTPFCASEPRALLSGTVYQDVDGSGDAAWQTIQTNSESGTNASAGITAYIFGTNPETSLITVLDKSAVSVDGTFSFTNCIQADNHQIILSTDDSSVQGDISISDGGTGLPAALLPSGWTATSPITRTGVSTLNGDIDDADLGIHLIPSSGALDVGGVVENDILQGTRYNPGVIGEFEIPVEAFGGIDPDPDGAIASVVITNLDNNILSITDGTTTIYKTDAQLAAAICPTSACVSLETVIAFEFSAGSNGQPTNSLSITPVESFLDGSVYVSYKTEDIAGALSDNTTQLEIQFIALKYEVSTGGWSNGSDGSGKPDITDGDKTLFWIDDPATASAILDINVEVKNMIIYADVDAVVTACLTVNDGVKNDGTIRFEALDDGTASGTPSYGQYKGPAMPNATFEVQLTTNGWHNIGFPVSKADGSALKAEDFKTVNNLGGEDIVNLTNDASTHNLWWYDTEIASGQEQGFFMNRSSNTINDGLGVGGYSTHAYGTWKMLGAGDDLNVHGANFYVDQNNTSSLPLIISAEGTTNADAKDFTTHDNWGGWNLVPNIYPVSLSARKLNGEAGAPDVFGNEFDKAIWIWNPNDAFESPVAGKFSKGAYIAVDVQTGAQIGYFPNAVNNALVADSLIAPFQSFYMRRVNGSKDRRATHGAVGNTVVESFAVNGSIDPQGVLKDDDQARTALTGTTNGNYNITLDPKHRSGCKITQHFKKSWDLIMLHAIDETDERLGDATELVFDHSFTNEIDPGYDINKLGTGKDAPVLFTVVDKEALVINKMAYPEEVTRIPLGFYSEFDGRPYRIEPIEIPSGWNVFLEDRLTKEWHDLNAGAYKFVNDSETSMNRFVMHFSMIYEPVDPAGPAIYAWSTDEGIEIRFDHIKSGNAEIILTNISGQTLFFDQKASTENNYIIPLEDGFEQFYVVTVKSKDIISSTKVVR